jgi:hypothetical protein
MLAIAIVPNPAEVADRPTRDRQSAAELLDPEAHAEVPKGVGIRDW